MTTTTRPRKTKFKADPLSAQKKREEAMDKLEQGIQSLLDSDRWKQWLTMMSQLRSLSGTRYSWQNCLLLLMQNPDATYVAGFHDWKKVGRSVKKGAKGLAIRAPFTKKLDEVDEQTGENKKFMYFNLVYVFDVSSTDGEPISEIAVPLKGDDVGLYKILFVLALQNSMPVFEEELDFYNGYCKFNKAGDKVEKIVISSSIPQKHKLKTLVHELSHGLLHGGVNYAEHRPMCELEAESTAFVVLNHFGIDSGEYSFGYVTSYCGDNAIAQLKESAARIQSTSNTIISWLEDCQEVVQL